MQKIKIRLPATATNLGPGIESLGLALRLYVTVEVSARRDTQVNVHIKGQGETGLAHPVVRAMSRFFQYMEQAVLGFDITVSDDIPPRSGLGANGALALAGVMGANNLLGDPLNRQEILALAARFSRADSVVASVQGGLAAALLIDDRLIYRSLPVQPVEIVVVVPDLPQYAPAPEPEQVPRRDALANLRRVPLLMQALADGDMELLAQVFDDRLHHPPPISGYGHVIEMAQRAGAVAVTSSEGGPALLAFAHANHARIGETMVEAFRSASVESRAWVLPVDTQGVVISAMQSV
jgi:homoserine kinase